MPAKGFEGTYAFSRATDLSPEVHGKVEEQEEQVRHAQAGQEEAGVVAGRTLPPADDGEGQSYGGVTDDTNLNIFKDSKYSY